MLKPRKAAPDTRATASSGPAVAPAAGSAAEQSPALAALLAEIAACRICREAPRGRPLPHEPRPVLQATATARLLISGQAPGTRVHASGRPFTDPSGERLRDWMGVTAEEFYDSRRVAVVPMGFCFPGQTEAGADLPPRAECAPAWRARVLAALPRVELVLLVGQYAQRWHGVIGRGETLSAAVGRWREVARGDGAGGVRLVPLPHPSWRNNAWLKANPWFAEELVPWLRAEVDRLVR